MGKTRLMTITMALAAVLFGCEGQSLQFQTRDIPPASPNHLAAAQQAYDAGQYEQALRHAQREYNIVGPDTDQAAYLAGMSAYRLGQREIARRYLTEAGESGDPQVAGAALAQLGVIYADREQFDQASRSLVRAAEYLDDSEKANAYYYAAQAERRLDRWWTARTYLILAQRYTDDQAFRRSIAQELGATGWTIQVGQFTDEAEARAFAQELAQRAQSLQVGMPRLVTAVDGRGERLFMVQIGEFSLYATAAEKRRELGINNAAVVSIQSAVQSDASR